MAKPKKQKTSNSVREEGTKLYKEGNLQEAAEKYEEASNLDTTDPAPLRALSSALFELGRYEDSISVIQKALALEKEEEKRKQLLVREGKCRFYLRDWAVLVKKLEGMELSQEEKKLVEASEGYKKNGDESESAWKEIVELPRTRPKAGPAEYYPHGHDEPSAAYSDEDLLARKTSMAKDEHLDITLLYGGIGDGRHFFQQLNHVISYLEKAKSANQKETTADKRPKDNFEFVLQDLKEQAIAKLLVLFSLLNSLSERQVENISTREASMERQELETTLTYVFAAAIVPPWVYNRMRAVMTLLIENSQITNGMASFGIPWVQVPASSVGPVISALRFWLADSEGILGLNSVKIIQDSPGFEVPAEAQDYMETHADIAEEFRQHTVTRMAPPPPNMTRVKEPALFELLQKPMKESEKTSKLKDYAAEKWKPNVTQIQEEAWFTWGSGELDVSGLSQPQTSHIGEYVYTIWNEATEYYGNLVMARHMVKARQSAKAYLNSIERLSPWFSAAARVFGQQQAGVRVVLQVGEITQQMDEYCFGVNGSKKRFDGIYLSNIPDYTGGHLSTLLYALPILKESNKRSFVQSNSIFSTSLFTEGLSNTTAEYLCLPDISAAKDLFGLSFQNTPLIQEVYKPELTQSSLFGPLLFFHRWELPSNNEFKLPNKTWFLRWLAQILLKMLLPVTRNYRANKVGFMQIEQPQTIYTFLRLCHLLLHRGIPTHWLSNFLDPLLSTGLLTTSSPPPCTSPLPPSSTINPYWPTTRKPTQTDRTYDLRPFLPELLTHLSIFTPILPLSLTSAALIPPRHTLVRLSLPTETIAHSALLAPWQQILTLTFYNPRAIDGVEAFDKTGWLRDQIVNGKQKDKKFSVGQNVVLVGGFRWTHESTEGRVKGLMPFRRGTAEWVMEEGVWGRMKEGGWKVLLVRTDEWTLVSEEHGVGEVKVLGRVGE